MRITLYIMLVLTFLPGRLQAETCVRWSEASPVGNLGTRALDEASGMVLSRKQADVMWLHNDSGDDARVFALSLSGKYLGQWELEGVDATDWEDIAWGPCPDGTDGCLWIADIGNNTRLRTELQIHRIEEPVVDRDQPAGAYTTKPLDTLRFVYPDGEHNNAEALMVGKTGAFWVVSKSSDAASIYRGEPSTEVITLKKVGTRKTFVDKVTAADLAPDESRFVIRGYDWAAEFSLGNTTIGKAFEGDFVALPLAAEPQGESIAYSNNSRALMTTSEERHQPILRYRCLELSKQTAPAVTPERGKIEIIDEDAPNLAGCSTTPRPSALWAFVLLGFIRYSRRDR